jgi:hypothetical protein
MDSNDDGQRYSVTLSESQVDGYWRKIGMSKEAWMGMPRATRVQAAWADMQAKIDAAEEALKKARESQGN